MRSAVALGFLLLMLSPAAMAQTGNAACSNPPPAAEVAPPATPSVAAGTIAERNRNFALAWANFLPLAESGDSDAERALGQLLMQNCTGLQDKRAGVGWLTKAADAGDIGGKNLLALAYLQGAGVGQDDAKAFALYSQAAAAGNALAQSQLGYLYLSGRGVAQDSYLGLQWTVKAAEQGNAVALGNIAHAYMKGELLERDTDRAAYFLAMANERATPPQRNILMGTAEEIRQAVSVDDLAYEAKRAHRWTPGPGSLRDVLSDAEDFRKHHK